MLFMRRPVSSSGRLSATMLVEPATTSHQQRGFDPGRTGRQGMKGERPAAKRSLLQHKNPLATRDPASRSISVPESVHRRNRAGNMAVPAEDMVDQAQRGVMRQYEEEMLWGEEPRVSSTSNWLVQHFAKLRGNSKYRNSTGMMVVTGREMLRELGDMGMFPEHLVVADGKKIPDWGGRGGAQIVRASANAMDEIAPESDGYVGNFRLPEAHMNEELIANQRQLKRVIVLDNVEDPGTLGSMMRTAAALAYDAVLMTNHCADMYDHRVVAAARGAHFQQVTKFYHLSDVDGDDPWSLVNHVADRNNLKPVIFSAQDGPDGTAVVAPSALNPDAAETVPPAPAWVQEALERRAAAAADATAASGAGAAAASGTQPQANEEDAMTPLVQAGVRAAPSASATAAALAGSWAESAGAGVASDPTAAASSLERQGVTDFNIDFHVAGGSNRRAQSTAETGEMLKPGLLVVAGPDHRTPLPERVALRMRRKPTVLELDDDDASAAPQLDGEHAALTDVAASTPSLSMSLPVVLYAMRESAQWDYMVPRDADATSVAADDARESQQLSRFVDIGPDRGRDLPSFNETEEDFKSRIRRQRKQQQTQRMQRYLMTDAERWEELQKARVRAQDKARATAMRNPLKQVPRDPAAADPRVRNLERVATKYPDFMGEMVEDGHDRESLRDVAEWASTYTPPPNYDGRFKPPEPKVRRGRVVATHNKSGR